MQLVLLSHQCSQMKPQVKQSRCCFAEAWLRQHRRQRFLESADASSFRNSASKLRVTPGRIMRIPHRGTARLPTMLISVSNGHKTFRCHNLTIRAGRPRYPRPFSYAQAKGSISAHMKILGCAYEYKRATHESIMTSMREGKIAFDGAN